MTEPTGRSKAEILGHDLAVLTGQIDALEAGAEIRLDQRSDPRSAPLWRPFHRRAAEQIRTHTLAILKAARAELLVELAAEVGLPARYEEALDHAVVVQQPPVPEAPALPPKAPKEDRP